MKKPISFIVWLVLVVLCNHSAHGQQTVHYNMSLEEMLGRADSANRTIRAYHTLTEEKEEWAKAAKKDYLPSIDAYLSLTYNGDGTITDRDFSNSFKAEIPSFGNNFALEVSQVIFSGGAVSSNVKISELQRDMARQDARDKREEVRFLIAGNYIEMCNLSNQIKVFDNNIELTSEILENMRSRFKEGTALQNDITRYELQLHQLKYKKIELQNSLLILNNRLLAALGLPAGGMIVPDMNKLPDNTPVLRQEEWQQITSESAPALKKAEINVRINEYKERLIKSGRYPKIAAVAAYCLNGPVTIEIPAIDKNFMYWYAGVGIKYNLDNLYKLGRSERAGRLSVQHANRMLAVCEEKTEQAVSEACIRYGESFVLLDTKQKNAELANQNYNVVSYRYDNDLVLITDLLDASSQKIDAELQVVNAQMNVLYNYYKLKYLTGTL